MPDPIPDLKAAITNLANREGRVSRYRAMLEGAVEELGRLRMVSSTMVCEHCNTKGTHQICPGCKQLTVPQIVVENKNLEVRIRHLETVIQGFMDSEVVSSA